MKTWHSDVAFRQLYRFGWNLISRHWVIRIILQATSTVVSCCCCRLNCWSKWFLSLCRQFFFRHWKSIGRQWTYTHTHTNSFNIYTIEMNHLNVTGTLLIFFFEFLGKRYFHSLSCCCCFYWLYDEEHVYYFRYDRI